MKLLNTYHFTTTVLLFEDDQGKAWELTTDSTGRYDWFPILPDEVSTWLEDTAPESAQSGLTGEAGNIRTGREQGNPITHDQRER